MARGDPRQDTGADISLGADVVGEARSSPPQDTGAAVVWP